MGTARTIVVAYGTASLCYGFALGIPLSRVRMAQPHGPRHLVTAHLSAIIQGAVHLALSVAFGLSELPPWLETLAAATLVTGSAFFVAGATANWLQGIGDHFAERSLGWKLLSASGPAHVAGVATLAVGVSRGVVTSIGVQ